MINKKAVTIGLLAFLAVLLYSAYRVFIVEDASSYVADASSYGENNLLENIQVLVLFFGFLVFLYQASRDTNKPLIYAFFAWLCLSFMLREVDVETLNLPAILIVLGSGIGRNILLLLGFIIIFSCALLKVKQYKVQFLDFLLSGAMGMIVAAGVCLFIGAGFEEASFKHHVYFEELIELFGYTLLALSTLVFTTPANRLDS